MQWKQYLAYWRDSTPPEWFLCRFLTPTIQILTWMLPRRCHLDPLPCTFAKLSSECRGPKTYLHRSCWENLPINLIKIISHAVIAFFYRKANILCTIFHWPSCCSMSARRPVSLLQIFLIQMPTWIALCCLWEVAILLDCIMTWSQLTRTFRCAVPESCFRVLCHVQVRTGRAPFISSLPYPGRDWLDTYICTYLIRTYTCQYVHDGPKPPVQTGPYFCTYCTYLQVYTCLYVHILAITCKNMTRFEHGVFGP